MTKEDLLSLCYLDYETNLGIYKNIDSYYYGNTDTQSKFIALENRTNRVLNTNFVQKLVDEEAFYSFSNNITYTSETGHEDVIKNINYNLKALKADHDLNCGIELIKFGKVFELNYIDKKTRKFMCKTITPLNGYAYTDTNGDIVFFMHIFNKKFDDKIYINIYDNEKIHHYDENLKLIAPSERHGFDIVPVGIGVIGEKGKKTIYKTIKTLQDALESNLSDSSCEITDSRNAILKLKNVRQPMQQVQVGEDENGKPVVKEVPMDILKNIILEITGDGDAEWLIKNINDAFINNTLDRLIDLIYSLTSHIDNNEKLASNISSIALRTRLNQLEAKCSLNEKIYSNIIKTRLYCLSQYLLPEGKNFDVLDININFTPKIPVDETNIADMISKIPQEIVSNETKRSWLPRISNTVAEGERIQKELENQFGGINLEEKVGIIDETI